MMRLAVSYAFGVFILIVLADNGTLEPIVDALSDYPPHVDKLVHFFMYGSLALVVNTALARRPRWSLVRAIATGSMIVLIASTVDECSNMLVPGRNWSLADLAANYLGIVCLGILPWLYFMAGFLMRSGDTQHRRC
jgi:VanZ family protein